MLLKLSTASSSSSGVKFFGNEPFNFCSSVGSSLANSIEDFLVTALSVGVDLGAGAIFLRNLVKPSFAF